MDTFRVITCNSAGGLDRPGAGAVLVQRLEVLPGDELAAVHAGLDGAEPPQDAHLLHGAHHRADVQPLQLGVHGVQPAHQVLQEEVEHLRQADELLAVHAEAGHLHAVHLHQLALAAKSGVGGGLRQAGRAGGQAGRAERAEPGERSQSGAASGHQRGGAAVAQAGQESAEHAAGEPRGRRQGVGVRVGVGVRRAGRAGGGDRGVERVRARAVERGRSWGARPRREERRGAGERHGGGAGGGEGAESDEGAHTLSSRCRSHTLTHFSSPRSFQLGKHLCVFLRLLPLTFSSSP